MSHHPSPSPTTPPAFPSPSPVPPDAAAAASSSPSSPSLHHPPPTTTDTTHLPSNPPEPTPPFTPFFTLLTSHSPSTNASSTHHPTVTYTFASDPPDTSPITAAALHSLSPAPSSTTSPSSPQSARSPSSPSSPQTPPRKTPLRREREERYILLDLDITGTKILSAQSMSPQWAVVGTEVGVAPHWEGEGGAAAGNDRGDRGLMLKIEGVEAPAPKKAVGREDGSPKGLEQLMEEYENGMRELRRVVEANGGDSDTCGDEMGELLGEGQRSIETPA